MDPDLKIISFVVTNHISVQAAAEYSGYSLHYMRRLLRLGGEMPHDNSFGSKKLTQNSDI